MKLSPTVAAVVVLLAEAQGSCTAGPVACTDIAVSSLSVWVEDEGGLPVADATVTASQGRDSLQHCASQGDGSYACDFYEVAGDFVVEVKKAGFVDHTADVLVESDGCHVITKTVTVVLVATDAPCCCAFIKAGDFDIISEEPAETTSACLARDQGACVDPALRFTPHPCCPDATGDRCG
ncbi:MAG: hypothetical protein IT382_21020 [Deltaproteobacteria bacterium]|nr:hypothetical protein [Deltaproteobacteria bacterium]